MKKFSQFHFSFKEALNTWHGYMKVINREYTLIFVLLLIFRDKVIRVTPKSSNEVDFLSSLESRQDLEVSLKEGPGDRRAWGATAM